MTPIKFRLIREGEVVGYEKHELNFRENKGGIEITHCDLKGVRVWNSSEDFMDQDYIPHDHKDRLVTVQNKVEIYENDRMVYQDYDRPIVGIVELAAGLFWQLSIDNGKDTESLSDIYWDYWKKVGSKWEEK